MYYYNGAQRYEQFLQVGWLYRALILLGLALCLPSTSVSSVLMVLYRYYNFLCSVSWAWWDWSLTWLTNHRPSVLWHCWLGYVTRKIVSEMTYNVSSGTLNSTIPYRIYFISLHQRSRFGYLNTINLLTYLHPERSIGVRVAGCGEALPGYVSEL